MKVLFVFNKSLKSSKARSKFGHIVSLLEKHQIDADIRKSEYHGHTIEIIKSADFSEYDAVVGAGGDGTLFELINGYYQNQSERRIPLALIPAGTGNSFIRDLGIDPDDIEIAIKALKNFKTRKVDVGKVSSNGNTFYYANILGLGFATDVTATGMNFKFLGKIAYTIGVLWHTLTLKHWKLDILIDNKPFKYDCTMLTISNSRYTGGDYFMAPNALINDGLLDITIAKKISRIRLLKLFSLIFRGEHTKAPEVGCFQAKSIEINTPKPKKVSPDGELFGKSPLKIECLQQDMEFIYYSNGEL